MLSNLPDGITENMIPGNRPEDQEWEDLFVWLGECGLYPNEIQALVKGGISSASNIGSSAGGGDGKGGTKNGEWISVDDKLPNNKKRNRILLYIPNREPQMAYSDTWANCGFSVECTPTHWMPLPETPAG